MTTPFPGPSSRQPAEQLRDSGYCVLPQALPPDLLSLAEAAFQEMAAEANDTLERMQEAGISRGEYYRSGKARLIVVPEADKATQACRFEYIQGTSAPYRNEIIPFCRRWIESLSGRQFTLFKDKCNLKSPGGGAFPPHQDIAAYLPFGPSFHVTAALFLDPGSAENGALQFADNFTGLRHDGIRAITTPMGRLPLFPTHEGGSQHGRIVDELEAQLNWQPAHTAAGDLVLFNSFIPHRSAANMSSMTRRAFFFTFNLLDEGDHYESYYRLKRQDYGNPHFHVATPTLRD